MFEIHVNGVPRTMRDDKEAAIEAARLLALRNPKVTIIDLKDGSEVPFAKPGQGG